MDAYSTVESTSALSGGYTSFELKGNIVGNASGSQRVYVVPTTRSRSLAGYRNPFWRNEVRLGNNATTPLSASDYYFGPAYVTIKTDFTYHSKSSPTLRQSRFEYFAGFLDPHGISNPTIPPSAVSDATNRCIRRFIASVNSARSSGNLTGRSIRHLEHDLHSVTNPMPQLRSQILGYLEQLTKIAHGKNLNLYSLLESVRSAYLEFEFGLRPFTEDLTSVLIDISRKRNFDVLPVSGYGRVRYQATTGVRTLIASDIGYALSLSPSQAYSTVSEYSVKYKGAVRTGCNKDGRISWSQDNRLLPRDWLPTLVSILPYDWLVNYFVNVNDIIDGLSFIFADLAWAQVTTRNQTTTTFDNIKFGRSVSDTVDLSAYQIDADNSYCSGGRSSCWARDVHRSVLSPAGLLPSLTFKVPTRPTQYLNMLAAMLPRVTRVVNLLATKL